MTTHRTSAAIDAAAEQLLDLAEEALDAGDPHRGIALCAQVLQSHPDHAGALFVTADAYRELGFLEEAEQAYRRVTFAVPDHAPGWSGLAAVLFDQLRFEESRRAALRALRQDPLNGEASYVRGMLRERRTDWDGAERDFVRASRGDPAPFLRPVALTDDMVQQLVDEATAKAPPDVRAFLQQVPLVIEEVPSEQVCRLFEPPAPPGEILGLFNGPGRTAEGDWSQQPSTIVLFRRNLQRFAAEREALLEELRISVFRDLEHILGLSEGDAEEA